MGLLHWIFSKEPPPPPKKRNFLLELIWRPIRFLLKKIITFAILLGIVAAAIYIIVTQGLNMTMSDAYSKCKDSITSILPSSEPPPPPPPPPPPLAPKEKTIYMEFKGKNIVLDGNFECQDPSGVSKILFEAKKKYPTSNLTISCRQKGNDSADRWQQVKKVLDNSGLKITFEKAE